MHNALLKPEFNNLDGFPEASLGQVISLADCTPGQEATVVAIKDCPPELRSKLCTMGLCPGHTVKVLYSATFGDPISIRVLNSSLALRLSEAQPILVSLKQ
jgi:Fe2+ transport system protein FeoA